MLNSLYVSLILSWLLLIWFETDGIWEYIKLTKLYTFGDTALGHYREVEALGATDLVLSAWLKEQYSDKFIVRVLTCPICLSTWFGLLAALLTLNWHSLTLAPLSYLGYRVLKKITN